MSFKIFHRMYVEINKNIDLVAALETVQIGCRKTKR